MPLPLTLTCVGSNQLSFKPSRSVNVGPWLLSTHKVARFHHRVFPPTHFCVGHGHKWGIQTLAEFIGGCGSGRLYCAIEPNGDVTPCVFIPSLWSETCGNRDFSRVGMRSESSTPSETERSLRDPVATASKCVCGGCRARSLGYLEDFNAPDVGCIYNQRSWNQLLVDLAKVYRVHELAFEPTIRRR